MRALTWHGKRDVRVDTVPDATIRDPDDVVVRITTTGLCGSDLHLYEVLGAFLGPGDILGHEPMGIVEEVGPAVTSLKPGDRVVIPFNVSCGSCFMCDQGLQSQCETTQVREHGTGASLFGYTKLYGQVPGGQAEYLRVPFGNSLPIRVPDGPADDRFVYLSDVLPTAWQAVEYASLLPGGSVAVLGLGPIGDMSCRIAAHRGTGTVIGIDLVPDRLERARRRGIHTLDLRECGDDLAEAARDLTDGRGPDAVIDARRNGGSRKPDRRRRARHDHLPAGRPGGGHDEAGRHRPALRPLHGHRPRPARRHRVGVRGVRGVRRCGRSHAPADHVRQAAAPAHGPGQRPALGRRHPPLLTGGDPLGVGDFATHRLPLEQAPDAYEMFQKKQDGAVKVLFTP